MNRSIIIAIWIVICSVTTVSLINASSLELLEPFSRKTSDSYGNPVVFFDIKSNIKFIVNVHGEFGRELINTSFYKNDSCIAKMERTHTNETHDFIMLELNDSRQVFVKADEYLCTDFVIHQEDKYIEVELKRDCSTKDDHECTMAFPMW